MKKLNHAKNDQNSQKFLIYQLRHEDVFTTYNPKKIRTLTAQKDYYAGNMTLTAQKDYYAGNM
ncbi:hypothetical protein RND71_014414 [Anisodus tanguticus]|uniref:Uncharacterized protein n=1 Tax=Anisodus tanguticus TaxID=243964 RepID=A0AAE1VMQ6_9SOLA|nr:hypothetical protein RND71_014414 [Anisodus tanguticus]